MSITITKEPTIPCFSKNLIQYKVTTTNSLAVKARVYVEDVPQSGTYDFLTELKQWPDSSGICTFNLHGLFEADVLRYIKPNLFNDNKVDTEICKRFKVDFFEYDPDALTLVEELYHEDSDSQTRSYVDITALDNYSSYIVVLEASANSLISPIFRNGTIDTFTTNLYSLGTEQWYSFTVPGSGTYDEIKIPGYTKAYIYQGSAYTISTSTVTFVLLGGYDVLNIYKDEPGPNAPSNLTLTIE